MMMDLILYILAQDLKNFIELALRAKKSICSILAKSFLLWSKSMGPKMTALAYWVL